MHANRSRNVTLAVLVAGLADSLGSAIAATPRHGARIVETTSNGYTLAVSVSGSGKTGRLSLGCPSGRSLGSSARFTFIMAASPRSARWGTCGYSVSAGTSIRVLTSAGSGSVRASACGGGIASSFSEDAVGTARMLSCPASSPESPLAAGTPYPFTGVVPNAALGTRLRLEYTDPNSATGQPAVVHLSTDSSGRFSDTHAFPASGGAVYGASATPRYPDDPLAPGTPCGLQVQG